MISVVQVCLLRSSSPNTACSKNRSKNQQLNVTKERTKQEKYLRDIELKLSGLYDAITDRLRGTALQSKIDAMENEKAKLISVLQTVAPATVSLHPALADPYKEKISELANILKGPKICDPAKLLIRELIEQVDITYNGNHWYISFKREIIRQSRKSLKLAHLLQAAPIKLE